MPRERLIAAMAESIVEKGYRDTTVADVVRIAHTSRRTFYEHFEDREACFLALFEQTTGGNMVRIAQSVRADAPWDEQIEAAIDTFIDGVCAQPELQRSFIRELPGLARGGGEHQRVVIERYAQMLVELVESGRREQPDTVAAPLPVDVAVMIVGGLRELLVISIQQGRDPRELRDSARQVVEAILGAIVLKQRGPSLT
jgi:AcrR family transcriptional regulator